MRTVNVGIIGLGTVGGGTYRLIERHRGKYRTAYGIDLQVTHACSLNRDAALAMGVPGDVWTDSWREVTGAADVDIVIEVIGGEHPATEIFEDAFAHGKHVVTANKALLGRHVEALARKAREAGVQIRCEAAAGGGIPIVGPLEHDLTGNEVLTIAGIMNGTTNYILSRMADEGLDFDEVLADAQRLGYAEADPTADVDGFDAASKIAILASIGFGTRVTTDDVYQQGIRKISAADIEQARSLGYVIKLLAIARNTDTGVDVRVHPTMIPAAHQLAAVSGAMNAIFVVGDAVGPTMFYGAGAGAFPTASAIVGDVLALADPIARGGRPAPEMEPFGRNLPVRSIDELQTKYYVRLTVEDRVGALSEAVGAFSRHDISISKINQLEEDAGEAGACSVIFLTHKALEGNMAAASAELGTLASVRSVDNVIRIEDVGAWTAGALDN